MRKLVIAPVVAAAIATSGVAIGAATASAAPACPGASVSVSPSTRLTPGQHFTITGSNFGCNGNTFVYASFYNTAHGQTGNGPRVTLDKNGSFTYSSAAPSELGAVTVSISGSTGTKFTNADAFDVVAATAASNPTAPAVAPTAVPAGHVDVARNGSGNSDEGVALVAAAGVVMIGAGLAGARRRTSRRVNG